MEELMNKVCFTVHAYAALKQHSSVTAIADHGLLYINTIQTFGGFFLKIFFLKAQYVDFCR